MLEQDPYDLPALLCLGRALLDDKRDAHALEAFRRVLKFDPDHVEALFQAGVALARLHRLAVARSEEHTSELQSRLHLVCRLLLEKKKNTQHTQLRYT